MTRIADSTVVPTSCAISCRVSSSGISIPSVGTAGGIALGVVVLTLELVAPLALGAWAFRRRDW